MNVQSKTNVSIMPKGPHGPVILWLASWYPCRIDAFNGDFVQRAAKALSLHYPVQVFYIMKDEEGKITKSHLIENDVIGQLTETRLYYHPPKTGIGSLDKVLSAWQYTKLGRTWLKNFRKKQHPAQSWIVEVGVAMRAGTLALWMKRKWNQPFLVQEHWTGYYRHLMPPDMQRSRLFWQMTHRILKQADALLPDSRHLGEWINTTYLPLKFREIPNTVDTSLFFFKEEVRVFSRFRFIHVSTLGYQKNTDGIIRAFKQLLKENPEMDIELMVVGPGFEPHKAFTETDEILKERVIFTGPKPYPGVAEAMLSANALVLFSRYENLPCVMLEAFCCGLPVIATRVGGIAYHLSPKEGLLVESESENDLLAAMEQLFKGYLAYNRALIAQNAAAKYGMQAIGNLYVKTYREFYPQLFDK
jgi:glycosyltransferase involved in cell wall biosynthesis